MWSVGRVIGRSDRIPCFAEGRIDDMSSECRRCDEYREILDGWFCCHRRPGEIIGEGNGKLIIRCYKHGKIVFW